MSDSVKEHKASAKASVKLGIVTVSDTRTLETDTSGLLIDQIATQAGHEVAWRKIVRDEPVEIQNVIAQSQLDPSIQAVLITGGTGISPRDQTVETLEKLFTKQIPGYGELFRWLSFQEIGPACILSRATGGLIGPLVVLLMPGSRAAVKLAMEQIIVPELPHLVREANK
jgi:molybdenum cofactor biosynthesis protein B